jgi:hypothetical protein
MMNINMTKDQTLMDETVMIKSTIRQLPWLIKLILHSINLINSFIALLCYDESTILEK